MPSFFAKELASHPLRLPNGHSVKFELVADDTGVLATEDGYLISELRNAINRKVGGVYEINSSEYDELKKNPPDKPSLPPWLTGQNLPQRVNNTIKQPSLANVVVEGRQQSGGGVAPPAKPAVRESTPLVVPQNIPITAKVKRKADVPKPETAVE